INDITDIDTPDTPPSPAHGTPLTEITSFTQRSPVIPRRRVMILAPGQPIPHGRPYRYHSNGPIHMMTTRKRVGPLPIQQLAVRHSVDHSSSDYFSPDDSARDPSSDSSSDLHSNASSDSSPRHSLSDHSSPDLPSTSAGPSHKRRRSPMTYVPALPHVFGALSPVRADLIPSPKRIRSLESVADLKGFRGTDIEVDDDVERSGEIDIDPVEAFIEACFDFVDIIRASGVDVRVEAMTVARDDVETSARDPIIVSDDGDTTPVMFHDHTEAILVHRIQVIEGVQREKMPNTRSGASMTHKEIEGLVTRRVAEEMEACEAAMNLEPLNEDGDEQEGENGGNGNRGNGGNGNGGNGNRGNRGNGNGGNGGNGNGGNGGNGNGGNGGNGNGNGGNRENGNGNRNRNHGMNYGGFMPVAR
ncbi:hypothetical protein Tco_1463875, partial [Tanacetum coccineum]